jgi:hypothetical protein
LQSSLLFFKTTPVLETFSSAPDGMPLIEAGWSKNNYQHSTSALKALVSVSIQESPLSQSLLPVSKNFLRAPLSGWQALCVKNCCAVPSGSSYPVKTCHLGFFSLQHLVCGYAAFSLCHRECNVGVERKHGSKRCGLQCLVRRGQRCLHQRDLCWQRNQCNHFRPGRGNHLLFCGDNVCGFGQGKSVLQRGVLPGSPECSDCELFKHLYRCCDYKCAGILHKQASPDQTDTAVLHQLHFQRLLDLLPPIGGVDTSIKLEPANLV